MKKILISALCAVGIICAVLFIRGETYSQTEFMLNTIIKITADNKSAVRACFDEIRRIEGLLSVYIPESEISEINSAPAGTPVPVSREVFDLLKTAEEYKELTGGAFDITVKPLTDLWNVAEGGYVPTDDEIKNAVSLISNMELDEAQLTVTLPREGMAIDLGGIAKGYAGDKVKEILLANNVKSAIADLGGNIVAIGKNGRKPWRVGLQKPDAPRGTSFADIEIEGKCVVTSGGYERNFEKDGTVYHHIFNPKTGKNPDNDILSVTISAENGTLADALSTACFVMGKEKAVETAKKCGADIVIYSSGDVYYTENMSIVMK